MSETTFTVRDLRRQWKPHKERLQQLNPEHPTNVRFHRACSWLQQAESLLEHKDWDNILLSQWIAFNALYGQWSEQDREPCADRESWRAFQERMVQLDGGGHVSGMLVANRRLAIKLFEDEYLSRYFWQEPGQDSKKRARRDGHQASTWFLEKRWLTILEKLLERIYFLRCQLVHGAATYNGALNRKATEYSAIMLGHVVRADLQVWIHYGADENWGHLCYPPLRG